LLNILIAAVVFFTAAVVLLIIVFALDCKNKKTDSIQQAIDPIKAIDAQIKYIQQSKEIIIPDSTLKDSVK
jgi:glucan phosphoethanolaminetransferase (alkaline phosphatase superfamily)